MRKFGFSIIVFLSFLLIMFHRGEIYPLNMDNIIAYPVPFNPNIQVLKIGYKPAVPPDTVDKVTIEIFDINGDTVFLRKYSSLNNPAIWNGYNNSGKKVKPGLYIIKITIENTQTGARGQKIIRIVVVH